MRRIGKFVSFWLIHFKFGSICLISWIGELFFDTVASWRSRVGVGVERGRKGERTRSHARCV